MIQGPQFNILQYCKQSNPLTLIWGHFNVVKFTQPYAGNYCNQAPFKNQILVKHASTVASEWLVNFEQSLAVWVVTNNYFCIPWSYVWNLRNSIFTILFNLDSYIYHIPWNVQQPSCPLKIIINEYSMNTNQYFLTTLCFIGTLMLQVDPPNPISVPH